LSEPVSIQPGKDETHVLLDAIITAVFIEPIDGNTLHDETIYLLQGSEKVECAIVQDPIRKEIVRLVPKEDLKPLTTYTVMVSKEILSQSGRSMKRDFKWDFATAPIISRTGGSVQSDDGLVELIIPPHALDEACVVSVRKIMLQSDTTIIDFFGFPYEIGPNKLIFKKSVTLIMTYFDNDVQSSINQQKISIYYKDNHWTRLGGTVENNRVTTTILENGIYRIGFDHQFNSSERGFLRNIQIQPRIISSSSGVHPHEAAISFELGNDMNITIRIYNCLLYTSPSPRD